MRSIAARLLAAAVLSAPPLAAQAADPLQFLPRGASANALVSSASGDLYVAGSLDGDAFIAKVPAGGSPASLLYRLAGSGFDSIASLAVDPAGAIFATGTTTSPDFPAITETGSLPSENSPQAFVLKLDADGTLQFATLIGGAVTHGSAIAVNEDGEALVSGQLADSGPEPFPTTPGAVSGNADTNTGFIVKLDRAGTKILLAIRGFGLGPVAYGPAGDIYVAGAAWGTAGISPTPGAFQATHELQICGGSGMFGLPCSYQYVARISSDGARLLYSTFVTGAFGATPSALVVDAAGNALVAGSTNSLDYPVTPGAFQTAYRAAYTPPYTPIGPHPRHFPPSSTGYITKLNADGTGLVWSTFFSGTGAESITGLRLDAEGGIVITGTSLSADLPGAQSVPAGCVPEFGRELPFVAHLDAGATALIASRYVYGLAFGATPALALGPGGTPVVAAGDGIKPVDLAASTPLACTTDPADNAGIVHAAPGQLITLFGDDFGEEPARVFIDDIAAPLLYTSPVQINAQVPFEVAGRDVSTLVVETAGGSTFSRPLRIVPRAPSAFLVIQDYQPGNPVMSCEGEAFSPGYPPVARNQDGTLNSCGNPAAPGSVVTFYLNGLGTAAPSVSLRYPESGAILAVEQDPDSPSGVWRMRVQLPVNASSGPIEPLIEGVPLRPAYLGIWVGR